MGRKDKVDRKVCLVLGSGHQVGCGRVVGVGRTSIGRAFGIGATMALGMIGLMLVCPVVGSEANAVESNQLLAPASVQVNPMIAIGLDQEAFNMEVTPKSSGTAAVETAKLTVSTNNTSGYKIYMHTADGSGNLKNLSQNANITPVADNSKLSDFAENTWGYYIDAAAVNDESTFHPVGTSANTAIKDVPTAHAAAASYNLAIATKVGTSLPAGTYSNVLVISAIANPIEITSMDQLFFMQDITPELCANATMEQQRQLTDTRDGKTYWVAKLKDGNCWMTQNLALDLTAGEILTADSTDLANAPGGQWVVPTSTQYGVTANSSSSFDESWNLGKYVYATPEKLTWCQPDHGGLTVSPGETLGERCANYVNVDGWLSGFITAQGTWNNIDTFVSVNAQDQTYDAHYLVGNYYQWYAATAGTGVAAFSENKNNTIAETDSSKLINATGSICPKGWKLPVAGANLAANEGWPFDLEDSFYRLFRAYGYPETGSSVTSESLSNEHWTLRSGSSSAAAKLRSLSGAYVFSSPFYFTLTGRITYNAGLYFPGMQSMVWSSTLKPSSSTEAYDLAMTDNGLAPSSYSTRGTGISIRCLAR